MSKKTKFLADSVVMSPECDSRHLHISHPDASCIQDHNIILAAICGLRIKCDVGRRNSPVHVLIFCLDGVGQLSTSETAQKRELIKPGQIAILPAHQPHFYKMAGSTWKGLWFYLADTPNWAHLRNQKPSIRAAVTLRELEAAMEGFLAESLRKENRARVAARHYAELILLNLERELDMEESPLAKEMRQELYTLWDAVNSNLSYSWTVADLADRIGISPQHFYRVSVRYCGRKPMEMVTRLRIQRAQELLKASDYSIKSIADRVGYIDPFSFSSAFKRHVGCSPRGFRNSQHSFLDSQENTKSISSVH
jgi:AraC-like DNA-binding protein